MIKKTLLRAALGTFALSCSSCVKEKLNEHLVSAEAELQREQLIYAAGPPSHSTPLTWEQALKLLYQQNPQLVRGTTQLDDIEKDRRRFYWDQLGPRLSTVASLSSALDGISDLTTDSISFQVYGSLRLPDPGSLYAQRYALELKYYTALLDYESSRRQTISNLYETFLAQEDLDKKAVLARKEIASNKSETIQQTLQRRTLNKHKDPKSQNRQQAERIRQRINTILSTPGHHWRLRPETIPSLNYKSRYQNLSFEKGFARLGLQQTAAQVEATRANLWRIKLDRLPSLSLGVSLPTLYSSTSESEPSFEDIRLFSGANKSYSFDDYEASSLRSAETRAKTTRTQISLRLEQEAGRFQELKSRYEKLLLAKKQLQRRSKIVRQNPPQPLPELLTQYINEVKKLDEEIAKTENTIRRMELEFWIWDERAWEKTRRAIKQ